MSDEKHRRGCEPQREAETSERPGNAEAPSRRTFLRKSATRAAYVAPLVLLARPKSAIAGSGGSDITNPA